MVSCGKLSKPCASCSIGAALGHQPRTLRKVAGFAELSRHALLPKDGQTELDPGCFAVDTDEQATDALRASTLSPQRGTETYE